MVLELVKNAEVVPRDPSVVAGARVAFRSVPPSGPPRTRTLRPVRTPPAASPPAAPSRTAPPATGPSLTPSPPAAPPERPWWASEPRPVGAAAPVGPGRSERAARSLFTDLARDVVDHTLRRRAVLTAVACGRTSPWELCDAHPHLVSAARHHGVPTSRSCPICKRTGLTDVHFVYGESLKHVAGQAKSPLEVRRLAAGNGREPRRFDVYVVEVCTHCRWNHLLRSFVAAAAAADPAAGPPGLGRTALGG